MVSYYKKRNIIYFVFLIFLPFITSSGFKKQSKSLNFNSNCEENLKYNQTNKQSHNEEIITLNSFTNLLYPIADFLEMEDFVKFICSLSKKQKKYIFRSYFFDLLNSLYVLNDKCEKQKFLDYQKIFFKHDSEFYECLTYNGKILFSSKIPSEIKPCGLFPKCNSFQLSCGIIAIGTFSSVLDQFPSIHYFSIFTQTLAVYKDANGRLETRMNFFHHRHQGSRIKIPEDVKLLNLNDDVSESNKNMLVFLNKFGTFVDKICFMNSYPKFSTIRPILLFRFLTSYPPLILFCLFPCEMNLINLLMKTLCVFHGPTRLLENLYFEYYLNTKTFKEIFPKNDFCPTKNDFWIKPYLRKFKFKGLVPRNDPPFISIGALPNFFLAFTYCYMMMFFIFNSHCSLEWEHFWKYCWKYFCINLTYEYVLRKK